MVSQSVYECLDINYINGVRGVFVVERKTPSPTE